MAGIPFSGKGSYIAVYDGSDDTFFILDNAELEYGSDLMIDDLGLSKGGGFSTGLHRNNVVPQIVVSLPEDEPSSVETQAFVQNKAYDLWCRRGRCTDPNTRFDLFESAIFKSISKSAKNQTGATRNVTVTFVFPTYDPLQPASDALDTYLTDIGREVTPP